MPEPFVVAIAAAALWAVLQLLLGARRDLSPATIACAGAAPILAGPTVGAVWWALAGVGVLAVMGAALATRRGTGRPELGAVVGVVVLLGLAARTTIAGPFLPTLAAAACGLAGALTTTISVAGLGASVPRVRWVGEIRVDPK